MSLGKPVIRAIFMEDEMRDFAISEAQKALDTSNSEKVQLNFNLFYIARGIIYEVDV